jgi:hypothetical protein
MKSAFFLFLLKEYKMYYTLQTKYAKLVAILSKIHYKVQIYLDITNVCELVQRCKIPNFKNIGFKTQIKK